MQGCDGFGCKLAGKKVIKEDTGEKEEIKMVFLDGQITDFAEQDEKKDSIDLWDTQVEELKRTLGI